jgi:hypothetical protein
VRGDEVARPKTGREVRAVDWEAEVDNVKLKNIRWSRQPLKGLLQKGREKKSYEFWAVVGGSAPSAVGGVMLPVSCL